MTLTFHTYHDVAEVYIDPPSKTALARYKADSDRCLADRKQRISDAIHRAYEAMRDAKPIQLIHIFLVQPSESEGPISARQPNRAIPLKGVQANGVRTFTGLY